MTDIPHLALPFNMKTQPNGTVTAQTVEQDSPDEIYGCVEAILRYEKGYRIERPDFGIADHVFQMGRLNTLDIIDDVRDQEPRAKVTITTQIDTLDQFMQYMSVQVGDNIGGDGSA